MRLRASKRLGALKVLDSTCAQSLHAWCRMQRNLILDKIIMCQEACGYAGIALDVAICRFLGAVETAAELFIMMEYAEGGSLWDMLSRIDDLPFARRMEVALDAARGLHYLHTNQPAVLHRDIKGYAQAMFCDADCFALLVMHVHQLP